MILSEKEKKPNKTSLCRYAIDLDGLGIVVWGKGSLVDAVSLHDTVAGEMVSRLDAHFNSTVPGGSDDPIPIAFERYVKTGKLNGLIPVPLRGTEFQRAIWRALFELPAGRLITYGELGRVIGKKNAGRAVGGAVGANPIPILIPCHRVVGKNGPGGFGSGRGALDIKAKLLSFEGLSLPEKK